MIRCAFQAISVLAVFTFCGCVTVPLNSEYTGPQPRPAHLEEYYSKQSGYGKVVKYLSARKKRYNLWRILIESESGPVTIDLFDAPGSDAELILVFPILGGGNFISNHFAGYFAAHGFDSAVVHRTNDFKNPEKIDQFEENLRKNVVRDRLAMDFFEREHGKKHFGAFGISRGGINVALTAGVDARLKHNVIALGGADLVDIVRTSNERRIRLFREYLIGKKGMSGEEFYAYMDDMIKTDPKYLARYMDARNTLLMLAVLDRTVPFKNGLLLSKEIGGPETIFLPGTHRTAALLSQIFKAVLPFEELCVIPPDYIETEALAFYRRGFGTGGGPLKLAPYSLVKLPFDFLAALLRIIF